MLGFRRRQKICAPQVAARCGMLLHPVSVRVEMDASGFVVPIAQTPTRPHDHTTNGFFPTRFNLLQIFTESV
jgi:hypothetical protein